MNATTLYSVMMHIRPAQACEVLKRAFHVKRRVMATRSGGSYYADPVSVFGMSLLRNGVFEPDLTHFFRAVLRERDVCIDLGGNEGYFSVLAGLCVGPEGVVHCIEPQGRLREVLSKNFELNSLHNITVHQIAIGLSEEPVRLFLRPSTNTGASSLFRHWNFGSAFETVQSTTLDGLFRRSSIRRARLLKVDCEGNECAVVRGSRQVLSAQLIDIIVMVYHPSICGESMCNETHAELTRAGYILIRVAGNCVYHVPGRTSGVDLISTAPRCDYWSD